uniref:EVA1 domain-containing protein n=1 Tax=Anas platyrhynchos TaxID=8839 RepID=A0A8B9QSA5_ANAPL
GGKISSPPRTPSNCLPLLSRRGPSLDWSLVKFLCHFLLLPSTLAPALLSSRRRSLVLAPSSLLFGEDVSKHGNTPRSPLSHRLPAAVPTGSAPGQAEQLNVPRKLLHETQPGPTNYQGFQKPHFPLRPRVFDPNVIGDGVFLSDVSPSNIGRALPAEKKKGRSATFYPLDNTPFLLPVDETQPPVFTSSMEPVGVSTEMALLSNILAAYAFITENPERAALYFVSGVCIGLVLTLLALVLRVSCRTDCKRSSAKKPPRERESDSDSSDSDDDSDTTSDLSARRHRRFERTLNMNVFTSAEELERAQRLEERERIIREIWMNGQPDIPGTRSLNRYY